MLLPVMKKLERYGELVNYWHPVAWSADLKDDPAPVVLMDTPIVLWRSQGKISAFYDLCIHRGTPLSLGRVSQVGELICGYHGWHYDTEGACTWIPSRDTSRSIPAKARALSFLTQEKHGLIWVCLGSPRAEIPDFPAEMDDTSFAAARVSDGLWDCNAARFIENMMDTSHFAWVHPGIFGSEEHPIVPDVTINQTVTGFTYQCTEPIGTMVEANAEHIRDYELTLPFMILFRVRQPGRTEREVIWYVCSPVGTAKTHFFFFSLRNYAHPMPQEERQAMTDLIQGQDRRMVEAQRPEELPLDLREELHLRGPDDVAVTYRRKLAELGIDWQ
jgi:phenylpropionate dioxygenase-like ring-hydroxylating dioxygenase large terminal subunit